MAFVTPTNVTVGSVLTASKYNQEVVENVKAIRGDYAEAKRTAGSYVLNGTSWADLDTGLDLVLAAAIDDVVEYSLTGLSQNEASDALLDVVTVVAGSPVTSFATRGAVRNTGQGVLAWRLNTGAATSFGGSAFYKLASGDISGGTVTLRLRRRTLTASNKTLFGTDDIPLLAAARNHGPVEV
jgi:hypothetical protein